MRLGVGFVGMEGEMKISSQPISFHVQSDLWIPRGCLLEFGAGIKQSVVGGKF